MKQLYKSDIYCKNPDCKIYEKWQTVKYDCLDLMFGDNPTLRKCPICGTNEVQYTSAREVFLCMTVEDVIQQLQKYNPKALFTLNIQISTCENGTCYEDVEQYVYDIFELDTSNKVVIQYSPCSD